MHYEHTYNASYVVIVMIRVNPNLALFCDITLTQLFVQSSSPLKVSSVEITRI